jgi:hypothetical protein
VKKKNCLHKKQRHISCPTCEWGARQNKKKKHVQFVVIWHFFKQGHPLTNFENFKELFQKN